MTFASVLIYVALIVLVLARRFRGHPIGNVKKLFALPVVVTIIGFADLSPGKLKPLAVTLIVIGAVVSLILFCVNIAAKLVLDFIGVAAGEAFSTAEKSLIFTLGLTLVGEAIVLSKRSGATWPGTTRSGADRSGVFGRPGRTGDAPVWVGTGPGHLSVPRQQAEPRSDAERYSERRHEHHHHDHHGRYED